MFDKFTKSVDVDDGLRGVAYWMFDPILQNENSPGYEDLGRIRYVSNVLVATVQCREPFELLDY